MNGWRARLKPWHQFCLNQSIYPLALSSLLAGSMLAGRLLIRRDWYYAFLVWNLFLAWIPYLCSLWAVYWHQRHPRHWWMLVMPGALWLIFLPNAPYIVTDLLHLRERLPVPFWYDIGLFASFAWSGLFLGVVSLSAMQSVVKNLFGRMAGWLLVFAAVILSGLGIYMGRFLDWNSWDLVLHPRTVLSDIGGRLLHPLSNAQTYGVSLMFAAFLLVCYFMFSSMQRRMELDAEQDR